MNKKLIYVLISSLLMLISSGAEAQVLSFEEASDLFAWRSENANIGLSSMRYKFGTSSLKITWTPGSTVTLDNGNTISFSNDDDLVVESIFAKYNGEKKKTRKLTLKK